ncbi:MAG: peptide chain release factor N(5)-glutamine methyltransferase [Candidatus Dormibacteraeota bacterium]|uniref:Release factor glutamine methyltransferase n=3 Tax=Candidatus Aeolococcus gillhamiae TaxID=3127015 RepID=A0A934K2I1_9BACT|nr:peptide chain release factor N(5)-glutamine methyltransferase [Candidatus Dormibacteraeota bacterium]
MEVVRLSTGYLESHGSSSPRLDAELLAATALRIRRLDLYLQFDRPLEEEQLSAIRELVRRRGDGEPVAHITGEREFYGRPFAVSADVLIPRPETETLVQLALQRARGQAHDGDGLRIADIGTGSGCVAITLAAELPGAAVTATDVSDAALAVAATNLRRLGLTERVALLRGSWCDPLQGRADPLQGRAFDIVVSNPPYVPSAELDGLARDVRDHEPALALDGGTDGLEAYRGLLPSIATVLAPGAWAAVEIDIREAAAVEALGREALGGSARPSVHNDLSGRPRVVAFEIIK